MTTSEQQIRIYDGGADDLMGSEQFPDRVSLLRADRVDSTDGGIRIMWGQDLLRDVVQGRYRAVVCAVNDEDNSHGIIAQLVERVPTSQWSANSVTSYARMFHEAVAVHASGDREPYILKFDLDGVLVLAMLRPRGAQSLTLEQLSHGLQTITKMLKGRADRLPVAAVSFLGARSNRLAGPDGSEPSFETVLRTMHEAGFRGDVYPALRMWELGGIGVFSRYPFPEGVARMREGSS
ncbi:MAG: hypothetical protein AAGB51_08335 [Planctomycetota bacterium]